MKSIFLKSYHSVRPLMFLSSLCVLLGWFYRIPWFCYNLHKLRWYSHLHQLSHLSFGHLLHLCVLQYFKLCIAPIN
jgi:hypothetical protein